MFRIADNLVLEDISTPCGVRVDHGVETLSSPGISACDAYRLFDESGVEYLELDGESCTAASARTSARPSELT